MNICFDIHTIRWSKKRHCDSKAHIRQRTSISSRCYGASVFIEIKYGIFALFLSLLLRRCKNFFDKNDGFFAQIAECFTICVFGYWFISAISRFVMFFSHFVGPESSFEWPLCTSVLYALAHLRTKIKCEREIWRKWLKFFYLIWLLFDSFVSSEIFHVRNTAPLDGIDFNTDFDPIFFRFIYMHHRSRKQKFTRSMWGEPDCQRREILEIEQQNRQNSWCVLLSRVRHSATATVQCTVDWCDRLNVSPSFTISLPLDVLTNWMKNLHTFVMFCQLSRIFESTRTPRTRTDFIFCVDAGRTWCTSPQCVRSNDWQFIQFLCYFSVLHC